jgi:hypothetical protein
LRQILSALSLWERVRVRDIIIVTNKLKFRKIPIDKYVEGHAPARAGHNLNGQQISLLIADRTKT